MKKMAMTGWILLTSGIVAEIFWRSQSERHLHYDNAGPGLYLMLPGVILVCIASQGIIRKVFMGFVWFLVINSALMFLVMLPLTEFASMSADQEIVVGIAILILSLVLVLWGTMKGIFPGTKKRLGISQRSPDEKQGLDE